MTRLLYYYQKKTDKLQALKAEIQFHKIIMERKSPLLKTTLKFPQLLDNLQQFLADLSGTEAERGREETRQATEGGDHDHAEGGDHDQAEGGDHDHAEGGDHDQAEGGDRRDDFDFKFTRSGTRVAVFYDGDFYLGEVTAVESDDLATVNFMERCLIRNEAYRWPHRVDETQVSAKYVFCANFELTTTNGRVWLLQDSDSVLERFATYKELFC